MEWLLRHRYTGHVRELRRLLWSSMVESRGDRLDVRPAAAPEAPPTARPQPLEDEAARIQAALDRNNGNQEATWQDLGLASRYALRRLIRKHHLIVRKGPG